MQPRARVLALLALALAVFFGVVLKGRESAAPPAAPVERTARESSPLPAQVSATELEAQAPVELSDPGDEDSAQCLARPLKPTTGTPAALSCRDARRIVAQVRSRLAVVGGRPAEHEFAEAMGGWLDPHGLWSAAPDAPALPLIRKIAGRLLDDVERLPQDSSPCAAAEEVAVQTKLWVEELRSALQTARALAQPISRARAFERVSRGIFEDDPVLRSSRVLARDLGERFGGFEQAFGEAGSELVENALGRLLPALTASDWTEVVLAAVTRAYVPGVDAHGQWAPLDEEWSLYASDSAIDPGPRLWGRMLRTALGVRIVAEPSAPLQAGDLVVSIAGIPTGGLSVEQLEQLALLEPYSGEVARRVRVLRRGADKPVELVVAIAPAGPVKTLSMLEAARVSFGQGSALVISVPDVPDRLGDELSELIAGASQHDPPQGILLDLRHNGGGSTDGAAGAIGVFLPGAPSFPLFRRGGIVEIGHAHVPEARGQWRGAVAVLVDGYTASAAEMIAGAIGSYERGVVLGARTFGKGCVQEYFDDRSGTGVLRLTTMLFSLPDGAALQGVGLRPAVQLPLGSPRERESALPAAAPPWQGPDVRIASIIGGPPWPSHRGRIGSCRDRLICAALQRLGARRPHVARHAASVRASAGPRRAAGG